MCGCFGSGLTLTQGPSSSVLRAVDFSFLEMLLQRMKMRLWGCWWRYTADCRWNGGKESVPSSCGAWGLVRSGSRWNSRGPRGNSNGTWFRVWAWVRLRHAFLEGCFEWRPNLADICIGKGKWICDWVELFFRWKMSCNFSLTRKAGHSPRPVRLGDFLEVPRFASVYCDEKYIGI